MILTIIAVLYLVGALAYLVTAGVALLTNPDSYVANYYLLIVCILLWPIPTVLALFVAGRGK